MTWAAWAVHAYTATGAVLAFLATRAVVAGDLRAAFLWLFAAVVVDASDGALARLARVHERLPHVSGEKIDDLVDYLTFVFVPVLIIWRAELVPAGWTLGVVAVVLLSSAYGFACADAKTADYFFTGFPSYWNVAALYLIVGRLPRAVNGAILLGLAALVFVRIRYVYPTRTPAWRRLTLLLTVVWGALVLAMILRLPDVPPVMVWVSLVFPVYYVMLSVVLHARRAPAVRRSILAFAVTIATTATLAAQSATGTIRGTVVDARDGTGLARVAVRVQNTRIDAMTDDRGEFELADVPVGAHDVYVSAVDFGPVSRRVDVEAGQTLALSIVLTEGTGPYTETVTVRARATRQDPTAVAEHTLGGSDLQQLRGILTNDPLRAIHVLPGVATGDDLRSEFSVRGAGPAQTNFTFEGVSTPFLVHTVQQTRETGSIAMVNGDVLDEVVLRSGAYPQRHGDRLGAELDFRMREGSRERTQGHVSISAIDAAAVFEGPLDTAKRGSWLASVRKSYLDLVIQALYPRQELAFGFSDAQAKLVYDLNARHQLQVAVTAGTSRLDRAPDTLGIGELQLADNASIVAVGAWRYAPSDRFAVTQRIAAASNTFRNTTREGVDIDNGRSRDLVARSDWTFAPRAGVTIEGGGEARRLEASQHDQRLASGRFQTREDFADSAFAASSYVHSRFTSARGRSIAPGLRVDWRTLGGRVSVSPWIGTLWPVGRLVSLRAGAGLARQTPSFLEVAGVRGSTTLREARAFTTELGVEGRLGALSRWQVTAYSREDRDLLRLPDVEPRLVNAAVTTVSLTSHYANALDGYARGVEFLVQRRTPNGLSGWASYSYGFNRYSDVSTGEVFWGDFDQRHTINLYGIYRLSHRLSLSARFRAGSNMPAPGYWRARDDGGYAVAAERNVLRVPPYSRLDVRANRTFIRQHFRLTLFLEALNAYARANRRFGAPSVNRRTFEVTNLFETLAPFIPSAGVLVEF